MSEVGGLNSSNSTALCLHVLPLYEELGFFLLPFFFFFLNTQPSWAFIFLTLSRDGNTEKYFSTIGEKGVGGPGDLRGVVGTGARLTAQALS